MTDFKLEDLLQLNKLNNIIRTKSEEENVKKTIKVILICLGAVALVGIIAYVIYRIVNRYDDNYDLYDDLDYYYDDADAEANGDAEPVVNEADFAE